MTADQVSIRVHRYSPRTVIAYGLLWLIGAIAFAFCSTVAAVQYVRTQNTSVLLPIMFVVFLIVWSVGAIVWLQNRPTLGLCEVGLLVSKFGRRTRFLRWAEIKTVEEFRRVNIQTGRQLRTYLLHWQGSSAGFDQYYNDLSGLIVGINEEIQKYSVPVVVHDYNPATIRAALRDARNPAQQKCIRMDGVVTTTTALEAN